MSVPIGNMTQGINKRHVRWWIEGIARRPRRRASDQVASALDDVDGAGDEQHEDEAGDYRLGHHQQLGAACQWICVGGAERGGRAEGEEEVVHESGRPAGGVASVLLRELEVRGLVPSGEAVARPAAVGLPVPDGEDEHVAGPEQPGRADQLAPRDLAAELSYQQRYRADQRGGEHGEQAEGQAARDWIWQGTLQKER